MTPKESSVKLSRASIAGEFMLSNQNWWEHPNGFYQFKQLAEGFLLEWSKTGKFGPTYGCWQLEKIEFKFKEFLDFHKVKS